jgi:hypothetical protein
MNLVSSSEELRVVTDVSSTFKCVPYHQERISGSI